MNILLLFFALPIATIILSIVLQKILKSPILVASTFFAIYLIVTFAAFDASFLVFAIIYTILAFITAAIVQAICKFVKHCCNNNNDNDNDNDNDDDDDSDVSDNSCGCNCTERTINNLAISNTNNSDYYNCYRSESYPSQNFMRRSRRK